MRIQRIRASGFRGFRDLVEVPLAPDFTVIDGRNGVGKSTIFDAVEFVLTGQITKYGDMKSGGETVEDYLWWKGEGPPPEERFVEVTFHDGEQPLTVRRSPLEDPDFETLQKVQAGMVNADTAPPSPLAQLCAASIIRDESIASLSLDLSETERYVKLRQAIGASDADLWIKRAANLLSVAKKRSEAAKTEVSNASAAVAQGSRRVDEVRAGIAPDDAIAEAASTVASLLGYGNTPPDQLVAPTREFVGGRERTIRALSALLARWDSYRESSARLSSLDAEIEKAEQAVLDAQADRALTLDPKAGAEDAPPQQLISDLHELRRLGTKIGLLDHSCPLCATAHDEASFATGLAETLKKIEKIDAEASEAAAEAARRREQVSAADRKIAEAKTMIQHLVVQATELRRSVREGNDALSSSGLGNEAEQSTVEATVQRHKIELEQAQRALGVLTTLSQNGQLQVATAGLVEAQTRLSRAQDRAGKARHAESVASALHDAARRAGSETLDLRLDRVLPLMAELYSRLRPHPVWQDIEYSIRGDLRRFLSLQVGDGLNPQFLFSSGQRRATGLAFLLSINLSLAWSRWRSILLDDPVQHVDDFRTVNLAEVLAQLVAGGRQVIVAVEDRALAELLARRMPVSAPGRALRLTLGPGPKGCPAIVDRRDPVPMADNVLAA